MIENVITTSPKVSITEVIKTLVENSIEGLPIVDQESRLLGMVTNGDILRAIKPLDGRIYNLFTFITYIEAQDLRNRFKVAAQTEVLKIATKNWIVTVYQDDGIERAVLLLAKHHFKKLPVIDKNNCVVGIISRGDVIRKFWVSILNK